MNKITKTIALAVAALGVSGGVANADGVVDGTALPQAVKQAKEGNVFPVVEVPLSERGVTTIPLDEHNVIVIAPVAANTRD